MLPSRSTPGYEKLPTELAEIEAEDSITESEEQDARFNPPTPAPWKRVALLTFLAVLFWLAFSLKSSQTKSKVIHANRYSNKYKFRPAASPVITETLDDGRVRLRGAIPHA